MLRSFARRAFAREMNGSVPDVVAQAVEHALTNPHPKIRYHAGKDAKLLATLSSILPDWLLDIIRLSSWAFLRGSGRWSRNEHLPKRI
jgi:hypothetical protein